MFLSILYVWIKFYIFYITTAYKKINTFDHVKLMLTCYNINQSARGM